MTNRKLNTTVKYLLGASALIGVGVGVSQMSTMQNVVHAKRSDSGLPGSMTAYDYSNETIGTDRDDDHAPGSEGSAIWNAGLTSNVSGASAFCNNYDLYGPHPSGHFTARGGTAPHAMRSGIMYAVTHHVPDLREVESFIIWETENANSADRIKSWTHVHDANGPARKYAHEAAECIDKNYPVTSGAPKVSAEKTSTSPHEIRWTFKLSNGVGLKNATLKYHGLPHGAYMTVHGGKVENNHSFGIVSDSRTSGHAIIALHDDNVDLTKTRFNFQGTISGSTDGDIQIQDYKTGGGGRHYQDVTLVKVTPRKFTKKLGAKATSTYKPRPHSTYLQEHQSYPVPIDMKISKVAEKSGKPMKNTHFDLVDASNGSVIASADTGDDGTAMFKNINHANGHLIPAGTPLKIVETSTDQNHYTMNNQSEVVASGMPATHWVQGHTYKWKKDKQNRPKMPSQSHPSKDQSASRVVNDLKSQEQSMVLGPFQFKDKAIINTPNIRSYAREPTDLGVVTGTQYVDAKKEHLKDTLDIHHLDGARQYKVVDTMENPETMTPVKINGQEVTGTQTFTAAAHYRDEHPNQKLTFDYPQVNLAGMANTDYIFQARIYDAKDNHLLGTEGDPMRGDDGSEMSDASQRIFVRKEHTHSQAHAGEDNDKTDSNATAHCGANDSTGQQIVNPYSHTRLNDDVNTDGLVPHHQYHIHEEVMEKSDDGKSVHPLHINGHTVETTKDFTADGDEDTINVSFNPFDTTQLNGKDLVIYYEVSPVSEESDILSEDHSVSDCNESIHITNPRLRSTATVDNDKESNPSHYSHMNDKVMYSDVAPYQPMTIDTMLANKNNTAVEVPGDGTNRPAWNYIEGKINTTPTETSGYEDVPQQEVGTGSNSKTSVNITKPSTRAQLNQLQPINDADYDTSMDKTAREADKGLSARVSGKINHDIYDIDTTSLRGKHPVFYDDLYNGDSQPITWHDDPDDKNETIYITNPKIWTEALLDDHKVSNPNVASRLKDLIRYKDVAPGHPLNFSSLAMDQKTGKPVVITEQDHDYNLMGRTEITPAAANGKTKVPLMEVAQGQPAKNQNGSTNDTNTANIKNMVVENVKDDRHVQHMKRAVDSIQDGGDDARANYHKLLTNDVNGLDSLVYDGKVGMPDNLIQACRDVENVIGNGQNVSVSDLNNITDKLNDVILDDCQQGDFLSQSDYHNRVQVYNETHDKNVKGANAKSGEATANNADNLPFTFTGTDGHMHTTTFGRMINTSGNQNATPDNLPSKTDTDEGSVLRRVHENNIQTSSTVKDDGNKSQFATPDNLDRDQSNTSDSIDDFQNPEKAKNHQYDIDTRKLRNVTMTMYEDMTSPDDHDMTGITTDASRANTDQSVRVTAPTISTMQTINNRKEVSSNVKLANFQDRVRFKDFAPDEKVALNAVEMDKGTKQPVTIDGQYLWGRQSFTPHKFDGDVNVNLQEQDVHPKYQWLVRELQANGDPSDDAQTLVNAQSKVTPSEALHMDKNKLDDNDIPKATNAQGGPGKSSENGGTPDATSGTHDGSTDAGNQSTGGINSNNDGEYEGDATDTVNTDDPDLRTNTSKNAIDLTPLDNYTDQSQTPGLKNKSFDWTAFETAENPKNGTAVTEHKDYSSADQSVKIDVPNQKHKKPQKQTTGGGGSKNNNGNQNSNYTPSKSVSKGGNSKSKGGSSNNQNGNKPSALNKGNKVNIQMPNSPSSPTKTLTPTGSTTSTETPSGSELGHYLTGTPVQTPEGRYGAPVPSLQTPTASGRLPYNTVPASTSVFHGPELQFARTSGPGRLNHGHWYNKLYKWFSIHF